MLRSVGLLLIFSLLLAGCWDRREINDVGFVLATALDTGPGEGTYQATSRIAIPNKLGGGQAGANRGGSTGPPYMKVTAKGKNLEEIRMDMVRQLSREFSTAHRRIIAVGEPLARRGIKGILDEYSRNPQNRLRTFVIVTKGMKSDKFLDTPYELEAYPAEALREMIKLQRNIPTTLRDYFIASTMPGMEPVLAAFSLPYKEQPRFALESIAIFRDFRLVGYVDKREAMFLNTLLGREPGGLVKVTIPEAKGDIWVAMQALKPRGEVNMQGGKPRFRFKVTATGRVQENETALDLRNPAIVEKLNKALTVQIKKDYESLLKKLQTEFKADSIGLGTMVYRKYPRYWKQIEQDWPTMFPQQKVEWQVQAEILEVGVTGPPLQLPENEVKR